MTVDEVGSAAVEGIAAEAVYEAEFETVPEAAVNKESVFGTGTALLAETCY